MAFYDLSKDARAKLALQIRAEIESDLSENAMENVIKYFGDEDTYIRKAAYLASGSIYKDAPQRIDAILKLLNSLMENNDEKVRQTVINAAGEIGIFSFGAIEHLLEKGLTDVHHKVRNAVIGSLKKMSAKNFRETFAFAEKYVNHPDAEIRREICHGVELRGRTHPEDILPLLRKLQYDKSRRVTDMLIHVIGQISYKKGCLEKVIAHLKTWENQPLIQKALKEIVEVHKQYQNFASRSSQEAEEYIRRAMN